MINQKFDYLYAENGRLKAVVVDKNGEPQVTDVTPDKPYSQSLITDGQGDTLVVSKKGQVMGVKEYKFAGDDRHLLNEYHRQLDSLGDWQINFNSAKEKQTYAFDQIGSGNHGIFATDEYYPKSGSYDFRYKSVECGKSDKVIVDFGAYPQADSVIFKDKYGVTYPISLKDNIITFTGVSQADTNYIYAYRGDKKIGKLFLNTYKPQTKYIELVSVNRAKIDKSITAEGLNKIFKGAVVNFKIETKSLDIQGLQTFTHGGSNWHSVYNDDQKKVLEAYDKEMKDGVYYLFFIDDVRDKKDSLGTSVSGYMPRGYNCGFIYEGGSLHTVAHELGHGVGNLEHAFSASNSSGKTQNLMDYSTGEELYHFQWNEIQDPSRVWMKWSKEESEGEWTTDGHYYLFTYLGMLMGMEYADAERLGRYAEEPDSHVFSKEDGKTVIMGDNKEVEVFHNYFEEGDFLPAHTASLIGSNDRYYDKKGREIRFATKGLSLYNWGQISLTAQDIFNGYVDVKDNILEHSQKIKVNDKLNYRLYFKSKTTYMAENTTWVIDELQQRNHALSSGYHGVELAVTAYAIKNAVQLGMKDDVHRYLLHRFGDVFAHLKFDGDEAKTKEKLRNSTKYTNTSLNDYIGALDYFFQTKVIQVSLNQEISGKIIEEEGIYSDGNMFYSTYPPDDTKRRLIMFSLTTKSSVKRISYDYLSLMQLIQKLNDDWNSHRDIKEQSSDAMNNSDLLNYFWEYYSFLEFKDLLLKVIKTRAYAIQNDKVMYGDAVTCVSGWTTGHSDDGTAPDEILRRSELFMLYVKRAAELLNIIRGVDNIQLGVDDAVKTIQSAVEWGLEASNAGVINVNARLDGVFSFLIECEKHKNDNEFYVYIPIKFLPDEIEGNVAKLEWWMYSRVGTGFGFNWDFTQSAENQRGVLEQYLDSKGYSVIEPKIVNEVKDDKNNPTPSYIGLKIRKQ